MRSECERCGVGLSSAGEALICSYECTFCPACGDELQHVRPNCGGQLVHRPKRMAAG